MSETRDETVVQRKRPAPAESVAGATAVDGSLTAGTPPTQSGPGSETRASTRKLTYRTPAETLRAEEVLRTRIFLGTVIVLMFLVGASVPFLGGDPTLKRLMIAGMALTAVVCGAFLYYIRDAENYTPQRAMIPASVTVGAAALGCNFFGLYSPAPMVLTFGIYFFSLTSSIGAAVVVYLAVASMQLGGSLLLAFEILPDHGLVSVEGIPLVDRLAMAAVVQVVLGLTFVLARMSRHATLTAMERLESALRQVGQREALLQEANQDLERALRGGRGRFSGERVGAWRLGEVLGRGAMGEVYEGRHEAKDVQAAVKLLHPEVQAEPEQLRRFLREAEVMSQLDSPHVVKVHDVGMGAGGSAPYIAMELLRGHDLAWHLRKRRRFPPKRVLELVDQVATALTRARAHEIVHRDLKPQNLFLSEEGGDRKIWKVLDFGVSKLGTKAGTLTRGHVIGTPGYMAPEQARGVAVDHRADVFSLGAIAYRALTGRPAFAGDEYPKIMFDLVYVQPTRPGELAPLPVDCDLALALALAKRPEDRLGAAEELAAALAAAFEERLAPELRDRANAILERHPWGGRENGA